MNSIATRSQLTKTSLGAGIRDYELDRSSAPVVEDPFTDRMLQVNDSALASYSQASQPSSPHIRCNTNAIDHKPTTPPTPTPTATKPVYDYCIPLNDLIGQAAPLTNPAVPAHSSSCDPLNDTSYIRASVQGWLQENIQSTSGLTTTKTSQEQGIQVNGRNRKRGASPELQQAGPSAQLTRKALNKHLASMMSSDQSSLTNDPSTPNKNPSSTTTISSHTPLSDSAKHVAPSLRPINVRYHMEQHRIFFDKGVLDKTEMADFRNLVLQVADAERPLGRKPKSEKSWQQRIKKITVHNEVTMLDQILRLLIKIGRQIPVEGPVNQEELHVDQRANDSMWEDFEDSDLNWIVDREFDHTFLPNTCSNVGYHAEIARALAKERGMKNPKPDRAYGLSVNDIQPPVSQEGGLRDHLTAWLNVAPTLQHVFFLIEGKSNAGDMNKAVNQAGWGGTVAVYTQRLLLEDTGQSNIMDDGPDRQTYVYTATVDDQAMSFWVNFAHVQTLIPSGEKIVNYHMEHVFSYHFRGPDAELYLRRVCHNILDWGVRTRHAMLEMRCERMYAFERRLIEQDAARRDPGEHGCEC